MRPQQILLVLLGVVTLCESTRVFQGSCAEERVLCEQLCEALSPDAYQCSCWEGHNLQDDGLSCKLDTDVQYSEEKEEVTTEVPTTSFPIASPPPGWKSKRPESSTYSWRRSSEYRKRKTSRTKPLSFSGSNYLEFPVKENAYLETNITIQFKLNEQKDGIIFFGGELSGYDFLSITMDGPNIITRHDCGEGTIEDMYHGSFKIGEWHEIKVWRKNCDSTEMSLDGGRKLVDKADEFKNFKGITMDEGVFLGAAPHNIEFLKQKTGTSEGFRGCVRLLIVNGETLLNTNETINKAYESAVATTPLYCGEEEPKVKKILIITDEMIANGTVDDYDDDEYTKLELFDLTQEGMPRLNKPPGLNPIPSSTVPPLGHPILKEIIASTESWISTTPVPVVKTWKVAHFDGSAKIVVPAPESILSYLELSVQFKTEKPNGVLFFWKEDSKFLIVTLENSFIKVYASLGVDATILRSENAVSLYHWHKLEVWRSGKGVLLKVNKQGWVESELHASKSDALEDSGHIFLGSLDVQDIPTVMQDVEGFSGCVKRVRLNGRNINMQSTHATNVSECFQDPCSNYGCPKSCVAHNSVPICQCEWPLAGRKCTETVDTTMNAMNFQGLSYLEVDNEFVMSHITGDSLDMAVNFKIKNKTQTVRQVLVSAGDVTHEDDFFELSVDPNHFVSFSLNLGSGTVILTHPKRIDVERWLTVEVFRKKNLVKLSVNGEDPITAFAPEGAEQLNVYRNVFIGNSHMPDGSPDGRDFTGMEGCIISVKFDKTVISHPTQAKTAINIQDCAI